MTGGACCRHVQEARGVKAAFHLMTEFHTIVVRDGVDPQEAHQAFLVIDEYRRRIAPDIPGAE